jgi:acyl-CoA synthetase (AMP-forming)/AMP-acid ligase II
VTALVWEDLLHHAAALHAQIDVSHVPLPPPWKGARRGQRCSHVIYTSGTSGQPKGVICEHAGLVAYMHAKCRAHALLPPLEASELSAHGSGVTPNQSQPGGRPGGAARPSRVLVTAAATWDPSLGDFFSSLRCADVSIVSVSLFTYIVRQSLLLLQKGYFVHSVRQ